MIIICNSSAHVNISHLVYCFVAGGMMCNFFIASYTFCYFEKGLCSLLNLCLVNSFGWAFALVLWALVLKTAFIRLFGFSWNIRHWCQHYCCLLVQPQKYRQWFVKLGNQNLSVRSRILVQNCETLSWDLWWKFSWPCYWAHRHTDFGWS